MTPFSLILEVTKILSKMNCMLLSFSQYTDLLSEMHFIFTWLSSAITHRAAGVYMADKVLRNASFCNLNHEQSPGFVNDRSMA